MTGMTVNKATAALTCDAEQGNPHPQWNPDQQADEHKADTRHYDRAILLAVLQLCTRIMISAWCA